MNSHLSGRIEGSFLNIVLKVRSMVDLNIVGNYYKHLLNTNNMDAWIKETNSMENVIDGLLNIKH